MTTSTTVTNYTAEQASQLVELYTGGASVGFIAEMMGKSTRSVIAKLSREGVYVAKGKTSTSSRVTKAQLITLIAAKVNSTDEQLESLEKATKEALEILASQL